MYHALCMCLWLPWDIFGSSLRHGGHERPSQKPEMAPKAQPKCWRVYAWSTPTASESATRRRNKGFADARLPDLRHLPLTPAATPSFLPSFVSRLSRLARRSFARVVSRGTTRESDRDHFDIFPSFARQSARKNMKLGLSNRFHRNLAPHSHNFSCGNNTCTDRTCCDD